MNITLEFDGEISRKVLEALKNGLSPEEISATVETGARAVVERNIERNYATKPNKLGATKTGYWERARGSIVATHDGGGATIRIREVGVRLHYYGGTVRASGRTSEVTGKPIRYLSIPVHRAAHGASVKEFGDRIYWRPFTDKNKAGLFFRRGAKPSARDPLYYILKKSVRIKPDPNVLPSESAILDGVRAEVNKMAAKRIDNP